MELAWLEVRRANWDTFTKLEVSKVNRVPLPKWMLFGIGKVAVRAGSGLDSV